MNSSNIFFFRMHVLVLGRAATVVELIILSNYHKWIPQEEYFPQRLGVSISLHVIAVLCLMFANVVKKIYSHLMVKSQMRTSWWVGWDPNSWP